jgi:hypothetical protein
LYPKKPTKVCWLILDRSTSMQNCRASTISAYNEYLESLKSQVTECELFVGLTIFSDPDKIEVGPCVPVASMVPLTEATYQLVGCTALNDAVALSIQAIEKAAREKSTETILCCILTDGHENASLEFAEAVGGQAKIKAMIEARKEKGWTFAFMGADLTAAAAKNIATGLGIGAGNTHSYQKAATADTMRLFACNSVGYLNSQKIGSSDFFNAADEEAPESSATILTGSSTG